MRVTEAFLATASIFLACTSGSAFQSTTQISRRALIPHSHSIQHITHHPPTPARPSLTIRSSSNDEDDDESATSEFDISEGYADAEETVLRINFSYPSPASDDSVGSDALAAVQEYTQSFPFAAVLPVQPLTYLPVKMPGGQPAVKVTFLRKKTAEKGSQDGGMLFTSCLVSEEDCDEDGSLDNYKKSIQLTAWRITKGQNISKIFSEKQIVLAFVKGLTEGRGEELLGGKVDVDSVFHFWM